MPYIEMPVPNLPEDHPDKKWFKSIPYMVNLEGESVQLIPDEVFDKIEENGVEVLGEGSECLVVALPDHPDKAIAYSFRNPNEGFDALRAKTSFYTHKIFNILFPHNFPKIYAAFGEDGEKNKGTVRERVYDFGYEGRKINHSFMKVHDFFRFVLGVRPEMFIDSNDENFVLTEEGDEYFVDLIHSSDFGSGSIRKVLSDSEGKILEYMDRNRLAFGFTDEDINRVTKYVGRLKEFEDSTNNQDQSNDIE